MAPKRPTHRNLISSTLSRVVSLIAPILRRSPAIPPVLPPIPAGRERQIERVSPPAFSLLVDRTDDRLSWKVQASEEIPTNETRALVTILRDLAYHFEARAELGEIIETLAEQGRGIAARRRGSGSRSSAPNDSERDNGGDGRAVPPPSNDERTNDD
jgi:hypothetical protein